MEGIAEMNGKARFLVGCVSIMLVAFFGCSSRVLNGADARVGVSVVKVILEGKTFDPPIEGVRSLSPAWDVDEDGFPEFFGIFSLSTGLEKNGGTKDSLGFLSGRDGKVIPVTESRFNRDLSGLEPVFLETFPRIGVEEEVGILVLGKMRDAPAKMRWVLLGKRFCKKKDFVLPSIPKEEGEKIEYMGSYGWERPDLFPRGVVLGFPGKKGRLFFYSLEKRSIGKTVFSGENRIIPGRRAVENLGRFGKDGKTVIGLFLYGKKNNLKGEFIFEFMRIPSFELVLRKSIPAYWGEEVWYSPHPSVLLGDLDGDDVNDLCVGMPVPSGEWGPGDSGKVSVFSGRDGKTIYCISGEKPCDEFGSTIVKVGDLDGDGIGEFAVGAPEYFYELSENWRGFVKIFSGRTGKEIVRLAGNRDVKYFGGRLECSGDLLFVGCGPPSEAVPVKEFYVYRLIK